MRRLKFPPYEYIKSLPTWDKEKDLPREYDWLLFDTPTSVHGSLSYNEDDSHFVFFDVWEGGYTGENDLGMRCKLNKTNYAKICKHAQKVFEEFYRELDKDYSWQWEKENNNEI